MWPHTIIYQETYRLFSSLFRFTPSSIVCDMHPDYLSARFAGRTGRGNRTAADRRSSITMPMRHP
ncbi:MAG: hypothetical protein MZV63_34780 [Marinilabiliales bacterium]|nr:hypothetical protein [Marinilabiliales bacterium]